MLPPTVTAALGTSDPVGDGAPAFELLTHHEFNAATGGLWRVTGPRGSAVLKLRVPGRGTPDGSARSAAWPTSPDPRHWNHWRRAPLAYRDGLAATASAASGIAGPLLLAADERPDGSFALWLEDIAGASGSGWGTPELAAFSHALGAAQATWTARLPDLPWLSRRRLRQYVASKPLPARLAWDHPTAVAVWPEALRAGLRRLWERRDTLVSAAESGPRTLCHLDVWPLNLLTATGGAVGPATGAGRRTALLDWAFVGEDIANLIPDCVADGLMPAELLPEISDTVIRCYLAGLRDAAAEWTRTTCAARWPRPERRNSAGWRR